MTAGDPPRVGLSGETAEQFEALAPDVQEAYMTWWAERENRRAAHRDTLEPFVAGWRAAERRGRPRPRRTG